MFSLVLSKLKKGHARIAQSGNASIFPLDWVTNEINNSHSWTSRKHCQGQSLRHKCSLKHWFVNHQSKPLFFQPSKPRLTTGLLPTLSEGFSATSQDIACKENKTGGEGFIHFWIAVTFDSSALVVGSSSSNTIEQAWSCITCFSACICQIPLHLSWAGRAAVHWGKDSSCIDQHLLQPLPLHQGRLWQFKAKGCCRTRWCSFGQGYRQIVVFAHRFQLRGHKGSLYTDTAVYPCMFELDVRDLWSLPKLDSLPVLTHCCQLRVTASVAEIWCWTA